MKKVFYILVLAIFSITGCSKDEEVIDAPKSIKKTSWHKYFNKDEVELASGGISQGRINSISTTFKVLGDTKFEVQSYISTSQRSVNQTFYGTYTYNSNNGEVIFKYSTLNFFGRNSDKGIINGDKMTLEGRYTFKKQ